MDEDASREAGGEPIAGIVCRGCQRERPLHAALDLVTGCDPERSSVTIRCPDCESDTGVELARGEVRVGGLEPGGEVEAAVTVPVRGLRVTARPGGLRVFARARVWSFTSGSTRGP